MGDKVVKSWESYRKYKGESIGSEGEDELYNKWAKGKFGNRLGEKLSKTSKKLRAGKKGRVSSITKKTKKKSKKGRLSGKIAGSGAALRKLETEYAAAVDSKRKARIRAQIALIEKRNKEKKAK